MIWISCALLCLAAVVVRCVRARGRWREVWWWSFSGGLAGLVFGSLLLVDQARVNAALGVPNITFLLSELVFILAAGSVNIYCYTLRKPTPNSAVMWGHVALTLAVTAAVTVGWMAAPIHTASYPTGDLVPLIYPQALTYEVLDHCFLLFTLVNVATVSRRRFLATPRRDVSRRIGLAVIAGGACSHIVASVLYLIRDVLQPVIGQPALRLAAIGDDFSGLSVLGIASGAIAFLVGPVVVSYLRDARLIRECRPLWSRLQSLYPEVALDVSGVAWLDRRSVLVTRCLIEISDGLRQLPTRRPALDLNPVAVVVDALIDPPLVGDFASRILPPTVTLNDERHMYRTISRAYARVRADGGTDPIGVQARAS